MDDLKAINLALHEAASAVPTSVPTREQVDRGLRQVRRGRRRRRAAAGGAALVALAVAAVALQVGLLSLPAWAPAVPVASTAQSSLAAGPTRGSLADDAAFIDALVDEAASYEREEGTGESWRIPDPGAVDVIFAGDLDGYRLALVEAPFRRGAREVRHQFWFMGAAGDPASELLQRDGTSASDSTLTTFTPDDVLGAVPGGRAVALAIGATGTRVTVEGPPQLAADGTVTWPRQDAEIGPDGTWSSSYANDDGVVFVTVAGLGAADVAARWTDEVRTAALRGVGTGRRTAAPVPQRLAESMQTAQLAAGLAVGASTRSLLWSGAVAGQGIDVVSINAPSGARVLVANVVALNQQASAVLAKDAPDALAFVLETDDGGPGTVSVLVGPAGSVDAEVTSAGTGTVVAVLADGVGSVEAPVGAAVTYRDGQGRALATTTVLDTLAEADSPVEQKLETVFR